MHGEHVFNATKMQLGIFKNFNMAFHDSEVTPTYKNIIRKVRNILTVALNKFPQVLPCYLVIVMNNNVIHDPTFVEFEFKTILKRVLNDVGRLLATRKEQIAPKCRNIWVDTEVFVARPLPKPAAVLLADNKFKATRRQVNSMLDDVVRTFDFEILNIDVINCEGDTLRTGGLTRELLHGAGDQMRDNASILR